MRFSALYRVRLADGHYKTISLDEDYSTHQKAWLAASAKWFFVAPEKIHIFSFTIHHEGKA